ncbi:hypothetical protein [Candidatus Manganitrophus noduliformans]|uniref:Uncharacterized protein n=1 Tax=Candidatus Manganitrophus noduliformans TaxID=2606439 RepID=A0A7X6DUE5_9BACT|nr:hypothetical protein [Candidatus Manganitrophus noduliformans]NKE73529.1 hypothetical protein [Candidatus Manganitrophus noduliformans]
MKDVVGILKGREGTERVEILLSRGEENEGKFYLRFLSWGEGIGWYPQKTIRLDSRQLHTLRIVLKRAEKLLEPKRIAKKQTRGKVLPFPLVRFERERHREGESATTPPVLI